MLLAKGYITLSLPFLFDFKNYVKVYSKTMFLHLIIFVFPQVFKHITSKLIYFISLHKCIIKTYLYGRTFFLFERLDTIYEEDNTSEKAIELFRDVLEDVEHIQLKMT